MVNCSAAVLGLVGCTWERAPEGALVGGLTQNWNMKRAGGVDGLGDTLSRSNFARTLARDSTMHARRITARWRVS